MAFVATVDQGERVRGAHQVQSSLGLVPWEWSSSEIQRTGPSTKAGNRRMRWLMVSLSVGVFRVHEIFHANGPGKPPLRGPSLLGDYAYP